MKIHDCLGPKMEMGSLTSEIDTVICNETYLLFGSTMRKLSTLHDLCLRKPNRLVGSANKISPKVRKA